MTSTTGNSGVTALSEVLERAASWIRRAAPRDPLSSTALSTLDAIGTSGPVRISELVARERISQPGMTSVVNRLAGASLVQRHADPADGRATLLTITDVGRARLAAFHAARAASLAVHIAALPPKHQQTLLDAVEALDVLTTRPVSPSVRITTEETRA